MIKKLILCVLVILMTGCATTGDPKAGGLFCWSEKKAVQRQDEKHLQLEEEKATGDTLTATTRDRAREKEAKLAELEKQRKELKDLDNELAKLEKDIKEKRNLTGAKLKKKEDAEIKIKGLKKEIQQLQTTVSLSIQERETKINVLNNEVNKLLEIMATL